MAWLTSCSFNEARIGRSAVDRELIVLPGDLRVNMDGNLCEEMPVEATRGSLLREIAT